MEVSDRFVQQQKEDLRRIARHTRGECAFGHGINEAWLMTGAASACRRVCIGFLTSAFQQLVLRHRYRHLGRYTDLDLRHAIRLDHAFGPPPVDHGMVRFAGAASDDAEVHGALVFPLPPVNAAAPGRHF